MLAVTFESVAPFLPLAVVLLCAVFVLISIAVDLRKLRRNSALRAVHGVAGAAFTAIVVGGALAMSLALAPAATATATGGPHPENSPTTAAVPTPEMTDTADVTDPRTDIQLPTLDLGETTAQ